MAPPDSRTPIPAPAALDAAALRDAQAIAERVAADEVAADLAREEYAANGMPTIEPGTAFARVAHAGESLYAVRHNAILERAPKDSTELLMSGGTAYLTQRRLLHVSAEMATDVPLSEIDEMVVSLERLVLIRLRDGSDMAVEVDQPRLFRVQIAAAIAVERATAGYS